MSPSIGLMTHWSIAAKGAGINRANTTSNKTRPPIHRAMKSHIFFIFYECNYLFGRQNYEK
jgi:hypothetical protein